MDIGASRRPATTREAVTAAGKPATVLVVADDVAKRNQLEGWLEWAGYEVCGCPGPGLPTTSPQIRERSCPLTRGVDLVVLDLELRGDFRGRKPAELGPARLLPRARLERRGPGRSGGRPAAHRRHGLHAGAEGSRRAATARNRSARPRAVRRSRPL